MLSLLPLESSERSSRKSLHKMHPLLGLPQIQSLGAYGAQRPLLKLRWQSPVMKHPRPTEELPARLTHKFSHTLVPTHLDKKL